jgi:hypothetical protein
MSGIWKRNHRVTAPDLDSTLSRGLPCRPALRRHPPRVPTSATAERRPADTPTRRYVSAPVGVEANAERKNDNEHEHDGGGRAKLRLSRGYPCCPVLRRHPPRVPTSATAERRPADPPIRRYVSAPVGVGRVGVGRVGVEANAERKDEDDNDNEHDRRTNAKR